MIWRFFEVLPKGKVGLWAPNPPCAKAPGSGFPGFTGSASCFIGSVEIGERKMLFTYLN
jgi:hypothetical protein